MALRLLSPCALYHTEGEACGGFVVAEFLQSKCYPSFTCTKPANDLLPNTSPGTCEKPEADEGGSTSEDFEVSPQGPPASATSSN
jgi:hypothetical protein